MVHFEHHYGDGFETPETAERSEWYDVTSHPHTRFDGLRPVIGATDCLSATVNFRNRILARLNETHDLSPVEITGSYSMGEGQVSMSAAYRLDDPYSLGNIRASLLVYEDNVFFCCGPGGNDTWQHVTRTIHDEPIVLLNENDEVTVGATIPIDPSWNSDELHFIAYLQDLDTMEIIQGFVIPEEPASAVDLAAAPAAGLLSVSPNPIRSAGTVSLSLSKEDAAGPVRLDLVAPDGRSVAELFRGTLTAGRHAFHWDGETATGGRLAGGLYFIRLSTRQGTQNAKITLID
jgi:hypothetical protein